MSRLRRSTATTHYADWWSPSIRGRGLPSTQSYDAGGQIATIADPGLNTRSYSYYPSTHSSSGKVHWEENGLGNRIYFAYNDMGQVTHVWGETEYPVKYVYNVYGQATELHTYQASGAGMWEGSQIPAAFSTETPSITNWIYDASTGLLNQKLYADGNGPSYTYYSSKLPHVRTWARGVTTTYSYNSAGEVTGIDYSDTTPDVAHSYTRDGQPLSTVDAAGSRQYQYENEGGRLSGETVNGGLFDQLAITSPSDALGRRRSIRVSLADEALAEIVYDYDQSNRLQSVSLGQLTSAYSYVAASDLIDSVTSTRSGVNRLTVSNSYDNSGRLSTVTNTAGGGSILSSHGYVYDSAHRITQVTLAGNDYWSFSYNSRNEVTNAAKHFGGWKQV